MLLQEDEEGGESEEDDEGDEEDEDDGEENLSIYLVIEVDHCDKGYQVIKHFKRFLKDKTYQVINLSHDKLINRKSFPVIKVKRNCNSQRSERDRWLVTFRLWRCFLLSANFSFF